jgi:polyisoprenoid-binding protein YceI
MYRRSLVTVVAALCFLVLGGTLVRAADEYSLDPAHSGVNFKISHLGISQISGRFNQFSGSFSIDPEPANCSFTLTIKTDSVDTNQPARDKHLRSPDFFNAKQFPEITFKSTAVKAAQDGYQVTGDLTMHGVTKSISFSLAGGKTAEFPAGVQRTGFTTDLVLKRSDFGITKFDKAVGDDVSVSISFEGTKK